MLLNKIKILVLAGATGFNTSAAKELVTKYTDPFTTFMLWVVPIAGIIAALIQGVKYILQDEDDRNRNKFSKTMKTILTVCVVLESLSAIFKIIGIAVS
jgi:hypothetical protein